MAHTAKKKKPPIHQLEEIHPDHKQEDVDSEEVSIKRARERTLTRRPWHDRTLLRSSSYQQLFLHGNLPAEHEDDSSSPEPVSTLDSPLSNEMEAGQTGNAPKSIPEIFFSRVWMSVSCSHMPSIIAIPHRAPSICTPGVVIRHHFQDWSQSIHNQFWAVPDGSWGIGIIRDKAIHSGGQFNYTSYQCKHPGMLSALSTAFQNKVWIVWWLIGEEESVFDASMTAIQFFLESSLMKGTLHEQVVDCRWRTRMICRISLGIVKYKMFMKMTLHPQTVLVIHFLWRSCIPPCHIKTL